MEESCEQEQDRRVIVSYGPAAPRLAGFPLGPEGQLPDCTVQYSTVQYSALQCSALQCTAVHCTALHTVQ